MSAGSVVLCVQSPSLPAHRLFGKHVGYLDTENSRKGIIQPDPWPVAGSRMCPEMCRTLQRT